MTRKLEKYMSFSVECGPSLLERGARRPEGVAAPIVKPCPFMAIPASTNHQSPIDVVFGLVAPFSWCLRRSSRVYFINTSVSPCHIETDIILD